MDLIGQTLGNYQILEPIGQGGMAWVYRAYQNSLNRSVAIKVLSTVHTRDAMFRQRFDREAKAVAQLSHPNIVPIYDFGNDEKRGLLYLVMEFIGGGNLRDRAQRYLSIADATNIVIPIAHALSYAHTRGVIHRDLKPSNILLSETRRPLLTDFGLAKLSDGTLSTESGFTIGTPAYMSPEQVMGESLDGRSDIYSLAMVLYELVTGHPAFQGETPLAILHQQVYELPISPRQLNGRVPRALESVILCALDKNRNERYMTADAFALAVENAMHESARTIVPVVNIPRPTLDATSGTAAVEPEPYDDGPSEYTSNLSFTRWLLTTLVKVALITTVIAALVSLGSALALAMIAERSIAAYDWNWTPINANQPSVIDDALVQNQFEQYLRASVSERLLSPKVSAHFEPNDNLVLLGEGVGGRWLIESRVYVLGGALQVQVEQINGVRPIVLGSIVSDGINRGLRHAFDSAPVKLERSTTAPGQLTLFPKRAAPAPGAYPLPSPTSK